MMQKTTLSVFATLIGTSGVGIVGANLLLLLLFAFHMKLRTDTWALSVNLSICDLTFGIAVIPVAVYNSLSGGGIFAEDGTACHLMGFLFVLLHLASLNSLVCATIDKFTEICFPLRYPQLITKRRIWIILALVWIYAAVVASFPFMGFGKYAFSTDVYICLPYFGSSTTVYSVLILSVGILGPITLISVLYIAIIQIARHQARRGTFMCNDQHCYYVPIRSYFKNTVILVVSAFYLLVCWVPMVIIGFYETFHSHDIPEIAKIVCTWLVVLMPGLNPWINSLAQRKYRKALRESWRKLKRIFENMGTSTEPTSENDRHSSTNQSHQCLPGNNTANPAQT